MIPKKREVDEHDQERHADVLRLREAAGDDLKTRCENTPESGSPQSASPAARNIGPVHGIARPALVTPSTSLVS